MSSKTTDDSAIIEVPVDLSTSEDVEGSSLESRSERIRRLNRERQRRRRMKLKMSRQDEPSMASEACNVNMNLDNLESLENANTGSDRTDSTVKVELEPSKSGLAGTKVTRPRSSRRKRPYSETIAIVDTTNPISSETTTNAITAEQCHGQIPTQSNELSQATDQLSVLVVASEIEVFGDNRNVLNGAENVEEQNPLESEDIGEAKRASRSRGVRREDEETRIPRRKRSSTNSDEEVTVRREKQRELKRKQKERMTPDQVEALRARYREWRRKRKEVMTNEQLEIIRRGNRERQRRRRERLGVRKRLGSSSSQGRGASEAVIQGLRNISQGRSASETSTSGDSSKGSVSELMSASGIVFDDKTAVVQGVGISPSSLPTMVSSPLQNAPNQGSPNILTVPVSLYNQVPSSQQAISTIPVIGPQGTILPAMPAGTFFPGVAMSGMQVFPGVPIPGSQAGLVPGNPNITTITTIPMTGLPGIQTTQGGFLSGIPVTSTTGNAHTIQQAFPAQSPLQRDGQVLHNFQTLLPMTPVQAAGPGMTFLTQLPFPGGVPGQVMPGQVHTVPDPKYTIANQATAQVQGIPSGAQLVQVPIPVEDPKPAEDPKTTTAPTKKAKSRGRKRNTSAAEMLASLSTYIPQTSTPMSSMLSALASSARDRQSSDVQASETNTQDKGKTETVVLEVSNAAPPPPQGQAAQQQTFNMYVAPQRGADAQPYMVRSPVSTTSSHSSIDVNANSYALAAMNNGPANIPHMNTFLTAISGANQRQEVHYATSTIKDPSQAVNVSKTSIAVSTDNISRVSKGTNTDVENRPDCSSSVGTMTDSLVQTSVATNTDVATNVIDEDGQAVKPETSQT